MRIQVLVVKVGRFLRRKVLEIGDMPKIVNHHKAPIHHNIDESMELM